MNQVGYSFLIHSFLTSYSFCVLYYSFLFSERKQTSNLHFTGAVRAIMDTYLNKAKEEGLPVWLESTNIHARDVYLHLGFKVVEEVWLAVGKADKFGNRIEGGEGIIIYAMIVEPDVVV